MTRLFLALALLCSGCDAPGAITTREDLPLEICGRTNGPPAIYDRLYKVFFSFGSAQLSERSRIILDELLAYQEREKGSIIVRGHVDSLEATKFHDLDLRRAIAVRDYLVTHGMIPDYFAVSMATSGDRAPGTPTPPRVAEPYNRYVDFYLNNFGVRGYLEKRKQCAAWIDRSCFGITATASDTACHMAATFLQK